MSPAKTHALFQLKVPGESVRILVFDTQDLSIGRAAENDLAIDEAEISRHHAVFTRKGGVCAVQDMGTSNGTFVNDQAVGRAELKSGDVVKVAEIELVYHETTKNPAQLGARAEYVSQLKGFGVPGATGDGEATILGLVDVAGAMPADSDDDFEVRPPGDFDFDLHEMASKGGAASGTRNLDLELGDLDSVGGAGDGLDDLDLDTVAPTPAKTEPRPRATAPVVETQVWDLEGEGAGSGDGRLSLSLEIEGLTPDLRAALEKLAGKMIGLPQLRIRIKGEDLG